MFQKKYKTEFTVDHCNGLKLIIEFILTNSEITDITLSDKLHLSAISEVLTMINRKTLDHKRKYKITLTPTQAIALAVLYNDYIAEQTTIGFIQNKLMQVSNEINQLFS